VLGILEGYDQQNTQLAGGKVRSLATDKTDEGI
jgi:hypothetical protein